MFGISEDFKSNISKWCEENNIAYNKSRIDNYKDMLTLEAISPEKISNRVSFAIARDIENNPIVGHCDFYESEICTNEEVEFIFKMRSLNGFCTVVNFEAGILRVVFIKSDFEKLIEKTENDLSIIDDDTSSSLKKIEELREQIRATEKQISEIDRYIYFRSNERQTIRDKIKRYKWFKSKLK